MNHPENERSSHVSLFELFLHSLKEVVTHDSDLFSLTSKRIPFSYRIAHNLEKELVDNLPDSLYSVQMGVPSCPDTKALIPDITIRDGNELLMNISVRGNYLSEAELLALHTLRMSSGSPLTLAVAVLPRSDYLLIYQSDEAFLDYFHYYIDHHHLSFLKRRESTEVGTSIKQLNLLPSVRRKGAPVR